MRKPNELQAGPVARLAGSLWVFSGLLIAGSALAQEAAPAAGADTSPEAAGTPGLEEIVVTARRREENLQRTPVAVTALSAGALEERAVTNLAAIDQLVPNMVSAKSGSGGSAGQFFLRGVGQNDYVVNLEPGVALYIDGVYFARTQGANLEMADLERIEVLRGPQGTLYGKNAAGGLINYISRSPDAPEQIAAKLSIASHNEVRGQFSFNRMLVDDRLYVGAAVVGMRNDGWVDSVAPSANVSPLGLGKGEFGERDVGSGGVSVLYKPTEELSLLLRGDLTEQDGSAQPVTLMGYRAGTVTGNLLPAEQIPDIGNFERTYADYRAPDDLRSRGISLTATYDGEVSFKSITAYRTLYQSTGFDFDTTWLNIAEQRQIVDQDQFSQELQASGSIFAGRVDWISGLYFLREELSQQLTLDARASPSSLTAGTVQFQEIAPVNKSYGAFVNLNIDLTDALSLTAAARYTRENKHIVRVTQRYPDLSLTTPLVTLMNREDEKEWDQFTPKVGLDYELADDVLLYASYSKGFRSGGFNARLAPSSADTFDPENVDSVEIGAKTELFDGTMRLNVAAFQSWYTDIQLLVREGTSIFTTNGGRAKIRGVELELDALVTDALRLNFAAGYLDTQLTKVAAGAVAVGIRPDNELGYSPEWTFSGGAEYTVNLGNGGSIRLRGDASYRSSMYYSATNNRYDYSPAFALVNGRIIYQTESEAWSVALFGTNLLDKEYARFLGDNTASPNTGFAYGVPGEPRRVGVELSFNF